MKVNGKKFVKVVLIGGKCIMVGILLGAWWIERTSLHGLLETRRQMRAEGVPLTPADLKRPLPSPERNAALDYEKLMQLLKSKPLRGDDTALSEVKRDVPSEINNMQQIRFAFSRRQDVVTLVHQAAKKPECNFNRDYSQGLNLLFPEYVSMRSGLHVLTNESALLLFDGKPLDAIHNEALGFHMAQHTNADSFLICRLVGIALNAITLRFMERVLYTAGEQPGIAEAVAKAIADNWRTVSIVEGMRGEVVIEEVTFAQLRAGTVRDEDTQPGETPKPALPRPPSFVGTAIIDANELHLLQYQHNCLAAVNLPPRESQAKLDVLAAEAFKYGRLPTRMIATLLIPVFSDARTKQTQGEAQKLIVCAAAAIMAYKQKHGKFPSELQQAMPTVPRDPFDEQALRYQQEGDGFVVYSVGPTGKFDGGTAAKRPNNNESLFRFPMPAYYTLAPR